MYERHGQGVYHWADGRRYEGSWCRDKKHGKGSYFWSDGDRYEGDYADDKMHGEGTYFFADGTRYGVASLCAAASPSVFIFRS